MKRLGLKRGDVILVKIENDDFMNAKFNEIKAALEGCGREYKVINIQDGVDISVLGRVVQPIEDEFIEDL